MNEEVQDEQVPGVTAPYRWGPTPLFTAGALALSAAELIAIFTRKPLDPYKDELLIGCTVFTSLFFWLSAVWAVSFLLRAVQRISARRRDSSHLRDLHLFAQSCFVFILPAGRGFCIREFFQTRRCLDFFPADPDLN